MDVKLYQAMDRMYWEIRELERLMVMLRGIFGEEASEKVREKLVDVYLNLDWVKEVGGEEALEIEKWLLEVVVAVDALEVL